MKSKFFIAIFITLSVLSIATTITILYNSIDSTEILNNIDGVTEDITKSTTQLETEVTTSNTVEKIEIEEITYSVEANSIIQLKPKVIPETAENKKLYYKSSNEDIAEVNTQGEVKGLSMGQCIIEVSSDDKSSVKEEYIIIVTDKRIEEINILNEYLNTKENSQLVKYDDNKTKEVHIEEVSINDYNKDSKYELFINYEIEENINIIEYGTIKDGIVETTKSYNDFTEIIESGYATYNEEIYTENSGNYYIKSELTIITGDKHTREVIFYIIDDKTMETEETKRYKDEYTYEKGSNKVNSSKFYIDGEEVKEEPYLTSLSTYFDGYIKYENLVKRYVEIEDTRYEKVSPVVDLGEHYNNRIEWKSKEEEIATVNSSGMITTKNIGETEVIGILECIEGNINKVTVNIKNASKKLTDYMESEKDKKIEGENKEELTLYGSKLIDIDSDEELELLMYYKGKNESQIDIAEEKAGEVERRVGMNTTQKNGYTLYYEIFKDNSSGNIIIQEKQIKSKDGTEEIEFIFNEYNEEKYIKYSEEYKVEKKEEEVTGYYIDGEKTQEEEFNIQTNQYRYYEDWDITR